MSAFVAKVQSNGAITILASRICGAQCAGYFDD